MEEDNFFNERAVAANKVDHREKLIRVVQPYELLYDKKNRHYKNRLSRANAWSSIGEKMGIDGDLCRVEWDRLRDNFYQSRRRMQGKTGSKAKKLPTWQYYEQVTFLPDVAHERQSASNFTMDLEDEQPEEDEEQPEEDESEMETLSAAASQPAASAAATTATLPPSTSNSRPVQQDAANRPATRPKTSVTTDRAGKADEVRQLLIDRLSSPPAVTLDYCQVYGMYIGSLLRELSFPDRSHVIATINAVFQAKFYAKNTGSAAATAAATSASNAAYDAMTYEYR